MNKKEVMYHVTDTASHIAFHLSLMRLVAEQYNGRDQDLKRWLNDIIISLAEADDQFNR